MVSTAMSFYFSKSHFEKPNRMDGFLNIETMTLINIMADKFKE